MISNERRRYVRARVAATATAWLRGVCKGSYIVENLSRGGVSISAGPAIRAGEEVKLVLQLPRGPVEILGTVLRCETRARDCSLAVRFETPSSYADTEIGSAVADALETASLAAASREEPTVLVVDDTLLAREALARDIRVLGREVACFAAALDAIDFLHRAGERVEVALVDVSETRGGRDLLALLAEQWPSIRRVPMSAPGRVLASVDDLASFGSEAGAVLHRPWSSESLTRALEG